MTKIKNSLPAFIVVDRFLEFVTEGFLNYKLNKNDISVLLFLSCRMNQNDYTCDITCSKIAKRTGLGIRTVKYSIDHLEEQKIIKITTSKLNSYTLTIPNIEKITWDNLKKLRLISDQRSASGALLDYESILNEVHTVHFDKEESAPHALNEVHPVHPYININNKSKANNTHYKPVCVSSLTNDQNLTSPSPTEIGKNPEVNLYDMNGIDLRVIKKSAAPVNNITGPDVNKLPLQENDHLKHFETFKNIYPKNPVHAETFIEAKKNWQSENLDLIAQIIFEDIKKRISLVWNEIEPRYIPLSKKYLEGRMWEKPIGERKNEEDRSSANRKSNSHDEVVGYFVSRLRRSVEDETKH